MLGRFERMLEDAVEGSVRRVFPTQLQPVQLAKAAARAMEESQVVGLSGTEVPNAYLVRLAPSDLERFADFRGTLSQQLAEYLRDYAADRGLRPVGPPAVELRGDEHARAGSVRVDARFVDLEPRRAQELDHALEGTRALRLAALRQREEAPPAAAAPALVDETGMRYPLEPSDVVVRLGRSLDNDIVIADQRVSRYHAQVRWDGSAWRVSDLGSTNGTYVDDRPVEGASLPLLPRGTLKVGGHTLRYEPD